MLSPYDNSLIGFCIYEDDMNPLIDTELFMEEREYNKCLYNVTVDLSVDNHAGFTFKVLSIEYLGDEIRQLNPDNLDTTFLSQISKDIAENYLDELIENA